MATGLAMLLALLRGQCPQVGDVITRVFDLGFEALAVTWRRESKGRRGCERGRVVVVVSVRGRGRDEKRAGGAWPAQA